MALIPTLAPAAIAALLLGGCALFQPKPDCRKLYEGDNEAIYKCEVESGQNEEVNSWKHPCKAPIVKLLVRNRTDRDIGHLRLNPFFNQRKGYLDAVGSGGYQANAYGSWGGGEPPFCADEIDYSKPATLTWEWGYQRNKKGHIISRESLPNGDKRKVTMPFPNPKGPQFLLNEKGERYGDGYLETEDICVIFHTLDKVEIKFC